MKKIYLPFLALLVAQVTQGQSLKTIEPDSAKPTTANWESGYRERVNVLLTAQPVWDPNRTNRGDSDNGKRYWPQLTAEMFKAKRDGNQAKLMEWINKEGASGMNSINEGTFNKPFSAPGYILYYFGYKNDLPTEQLDRAKNMWFSVGRQQTSRVDGSMDPIYKCSEYNSENFNWMGRIGGYMLSQEFADATPLEVKDPNGQPGFGDGVPATTYYEDYLKNMVRGTFNAGRVEWGSHIYTGFCLQAAMMLNQFAPDKKYKDIGKALADWLMIETAINYLDGAYVAAGTRDKGHGYKPIDGSIWPYYYLFFTAPGSPNVDSQVFQQHFYQPTLTDDPAKWSVGFLPKITYRPAQSIIDLAQRKYKTPVELHSAKPHWHLDEENYKDWKAETEKSKRNEFETKYLEKNYTLASLASYRPVGVGPFSEQALWRFGVKQPNALTEQVFGNSGTYTGMNGRNPNEEIGQYRSAMMRMIKNTDNLWVALPKTKTLEYVGDTLAFVDMNSGVYAVFRLYGATGAPTSEELVTLGKDNEIVKTHMKYTWKFDPNKIGAMVLEAGTEEEYGSFANFKTAIENKSRLTSTGSDELVYKGANNHELKMQYVTPGSMTYTENNCNKAVVDPAGVPGKVWGDGNFIDYSKWNIYEVVYGEPILHSEWGKGQITVNAGGKGTRITIDQATADVKYEVSDTPIGVPTSIGSAKKSAQSDIRLSAFAPNPINGVAHATFSVESPQHVKVVVYDLLGKKLATLREVKALAGTPYEVVLSASNLSNGSYVVRLEGERFTVSQKIAVLK